MNLIALAHIWRDRPPSGRFVLHRLPETGWCNRHGPVTKYHTCKETCTACGFTCLPGCSRDCIEPGVAE